eukprot:CAMPEP_0183353522 /NCGR_PEP_ID=MMETSP0164_2-20130417/33435_1 /TAXON_ID=221442 /ORGANISM="Coccolithus pelagicus ssp braarudi, Strain PLY182g" /LENGTH=319 /DNA_ID=CAMNT_0025526199 /DNA_START=84 /DNA_END=1043 /DNA_ORIENTATION=-
MQVRLPARIVFEAPPGATSRSICAKLNPTTRDLDPALMHAEMWFIDAAQCESACAASVQCKAYEFASFGTDHRGKKRCELQVEEVTGAIPADGHTCKVKISLGANSPQRASFNKLPGSLGLQGRYAAPHPASTTASSATTTVPAAGPGLATSRGNCPPPTKTCGCCSLMGPGVDLTVAACTDLKNADLRGMNLEGAVLEDVDITCAVFDKAILKGTDFKNAVGERASFKGINGEGMGYDETNTPNADFSGAMLMGATFELAQLTGSSFKKATIDGAVFMTATLERADFTGAIGGANADFTMAMGINTVVGLVRTPTATG